MTQTDDLQADGYYGDEDLGSDDIDLSFLDENNEDNHKPSKEE